MTISSRAIKAAWDYQSELSSCYVANWSFIRSIHLWTEWEMTLISLLFLSSSVTPRLTIATTAFQNSAFSDTILTVLSSFTAKSVA